jgi:ribonuclease BN (tRNA processing enzyme)
MYQFSLTVLGTRGSVTVSGKEYERFGGMTSCYLVRAGEQIVFLDAGTGIIQAPETEESEPVILISHLHLDHVVGLGMYPRLSKKGRCTRVYLPAKDDSAALEKLDSLYAPPYWPCSLTDYSGTLDVHALNLPMKIGEVLIEGMEGNHPGGCVIMKLSYQGKSIVYATDYEYERTSFERLKAFAKDCDLLLYDAQYTEEEYEKKKGFGHSTAEKGIELMNSCKAKRMLLVHHDPQSTDNELERRELILAVPNAHYAKEDEEILL